MPLGIRSTKFETTGLHAVLFSPLHYALSQVFVVGADRCSTTLTHCNFGELLKMPQRSVKGIVFTIIANIYTIKTPNNRWVASGHLEVVSDVIVIVFKLPLSMVAHRCTSGGLKRKVGNDPDGVRSLI